MTHRKVFYLGALLSLTLLVLVAGCDTTTTTKTVKPKSSVEFTAYAYQHGIAGVEFGQLGVRRGSNPAVRTFAQQLVQDNTEANKQLKFTADDAKLSLPAGPTADQITTRDTLAALTGADFDKAYMTEMVKDLEDTKAEFEAHSATGDIDVIKRFAARLVGMLSEDLGMARDTAAKVGAK